MAQYNKYMLKLPSYISFIIILVDIIKVVIIDDIIKLVLWNNSLMDEFIINPPLKHNKKDGIIFLYLINSKKLFILFFFFLK